MSKEMLKDERIIDLIVKTVIGRHGQVVYTTKASEWVDVRRLMLFMLLLWRQPTHYHQSTRGAKYCWQAIHSTCNQVLWTFVRRIWCWAYCCYPFYPPYSLQNIQHIYQYWNRWLHEDIAVDTLSTSSIFSGSQNTAQHQERQWKCSTTLTYTTSLLGMLPASTQTSIKASNDFQQFTKGLKANHLVPLKSFDYDITPTLEYLISLGPKESMPTTNLTVKTAWLLSMVVVLRPSDLARVDLDQCIIFNDNVLQLIVVAPKEKRGSSRITKAITILPHSSESFFAQWRLISHTLLA